MSRRTRICLAASGGGHAHQLLELEPAWSGLDAYLVSEDTALSQSLTGRRRTYFVRHFSLGQGKLGAPVRMALNGVVNFFQSAVIALRERPSIVISTGAGSVFFTVFWAKLLGAKVVVLESYARFERLSAFARMAGPLADARVVRSAALSQFWPRAAVFDALKIPDDAPIPEKKPLVFVTVGATLPFDRLVTAVADLKQRGRIPEAVRIQTGVGGVKPDGIETRETLPFDDMIASMREAEIAVCHGGTGSLFTALGEGCKVVAMARTFERGEHFDNHQTELTSALAARGLITVAASAEDMEAALARARTTRPVIVRRDPSALIEHLAALIAGWSRGAPSARAAGAPVSTLAE